MKNACILGFVVLVSLAFGSLPKPSDWKEPICPQFVFDLARKDFVSLSKNERVESQDEFCREYTGGFFDGFTSPAASIAWTAKKGGSYRGFYAGQKYLKDHRDSLTRVMKAYGYEEVDVIGVWESGFEVSAFYVEGKDMHSPWSLEQMLAVLPRPKDAKIVARLRVARLQVHGFLSPVDRYGHMGRYEREIYIISADVKEAFVPLEQEAKAGPDVPSP